MDDSNKTKKEFNYKGAFHILCGAVLLLLLVFLMMLIMQKQTVKESELISDIITENTPDRAAAQQDQLLININTASEIELTLLPGIGDGRARDIVAYRNEYGRFTKPEDLLNIKGIGESVLENILPYIVFEDP